MARFVAALIAIAATSPLLPAQIVAQPLPLVPAGQPAIKGKSPKEADGPKDDAKALSEAKLSATDPAGLIAYLRGRTLSEVDLNKIKSVIERMGDESFEERNKASAEAISFGPAAIGPLRTAATKTGTGIDPEVQYRAQEALRTIEKVSHAIVASATARALAKAKPPEASAALLGFLPMADNTSVDEDIRLALKTLAIQDGKLDSAIVAAIKDVNPVRRGAAGVALIEASMESKSLASEVAKLVEPLLVSEPDADAKFRVAYVLATTGKNPLAVAALVETLPSLPRGRLWQVEDYLLQLAGDKAPKIKLPSDKLALEKSRDAWLAWLKANRKPEDYAKFEYKPKTTGRLMMLTVDQNWGSGRIAELGSDLQTRWRVSGITSPADFRMLPDGKLEVMEHNYSRITTHDLRTRDKKVQQLPGGPPMSLQRLENGNALVAYRNSVIEYDANWKEVKDRNWVRNNHDVLAAARVDNGPTYVLAGQNPGQLIKLDDKFKELPNPVKVGDAHWQAKLELLPNDRALVTEQQKVSEYDLKTGKEVWTFKCSNPTCVQRLPNGNTLVSDIGNRTIKEIAPDGEMLWSHTPADNYQPLRAYRQ